MQEVFGNCGSLRNLDLSSWDTSSVKQLVYMFRNCSNLETIYVSEKWSTDALETGAFSNGIGYNDRIFEGCSKLVGSNGTTYADNHIDYSSTLDDRAYAQIDNEDGQVGYLTDANINMVIKNGSVYKIASAVRHINGSIDKYNPLEITNAINEVGSEVNAQSVLIEQIISTLEDKAVEGTAEPFAYIFVTYPEDSICTCTDGVKTLTAKNTDGTYVFCVPHDGEWTVASTDLEDSTKTKSQIVEITEEGQFESIKLDYKLVLFAPGGTDKMSIGFATSVSAGLANLTVGDTAKITSQTNGAISYMSNEPIDLTNYSVIKCENVAYSGNGFLIIDTIRDRNCAAEMPVARTIEASLPVDTYTGNYYVGITCFLGGWKEIAGLTLE
jgi:surface protein